MTGKTHLVCGLLCGELIVIGQNITDINTMSFVVLATAVGAIFPDIDQPQSMMSGSSGVAKSMSRTIASVTQHRGITHTLAFMALIWYLFSFLMPYLGHYGPTVRACFIVGMISHLMLDTLNEKGIMWFWPFIWKHIHILRIRTGSPAEIIFRFLMDIATTLALAVIILERLHFL